MNFDPDKPIVTLTETAAVHVRSLMDRADNDVIGIRVGVKTAGCSGMQYDVQFATEQKPFEDKIDVCIHFRSDMARFLAPKINEKLENIGSKRHHKIDQFLDRFFIEFCSVLEANLHPCWPPFSA